MADNGHGIDSDPDGDTIAVTHVAGLAGNLGVAVAGSNGGSFAINSDGSYSFTTNTDFEDLAVGQTRDTTVTYTITDEDGATSTATVTVTVTGENDAPTTIGSVADQTNDDGDAINLDLSGFFADGDTADALTFSHGGTLPPGLDIDSLTGVISGTISSSASVGGPYAVIITASDGNGGTTTQSFTWTVNNPVPTAFDDDLGTTEHASIVGNVVIADNGNGVDSDPDGDLISVTSVDSSPGNVGVAVSGSQGGTFTINSDGSYQFLPGADFDDLAAGESRHTSVSYTITDADGASSTATVTVTVTGENDDPTSASIPDKSNQDGESLSTDISPFFSDGDSSDILSLRMAGHYRRDCCWMRRRERSVARSHHLRRQEARTL